eukprot:TRINITY_DN2146_c0_g1_i1.p1 TRINITY_DN2146_c0_g1~~TRINITY_DN2146_c0_g1_i1.p1  ORF type:complete len:411 (-),score=85.76 TRINITY_DN2146_c0_g1_i1:1127-2236(-)
MHNNTVVRNGKTIPVSSRSPSRSRSQSPKDPAAAQQQSAKSSNNNKLRSRGKGAMDSAAVFATGIDSPNQIELKRKKKQLAARRKQITLFRHPLITLQHFGYIVLQWSISVFEFAVKHKITVSVVLLSGFILFLLSVFHGPHSFIVEHIEHFVAFAVWWGGLGVLSSIGLGTGLHTFVLYLGPFIAQTTLAASECNSILFDTSGPRKFICPDDPAILTQPGPTFWDVLSKVQLAAFLWGAGTALGELPPYFVALASHRSGKRVEDLDGPSKGKDGLMDSMKGWVVYFLDKFGFWAIVVFASVPNPLFDLAGLTCGHFGVPFWTFFGATFIGKAVIKAHLQTFVVIIMFNKKHLEDLINFVSLALLAVFS